MSRNVNVLLEMDDSHLTQKHPSVLRLGLVARGAYEDPCLEIIASDGISNSIWLDEGMLDDILRTILDILGDAAYT